MIGLIIGFFAFYPLTLEDSESERMRVYKEAYANGLMTKEIDKNDIVVYRWIETHKLGYE